MQSGTVQPIDSGDRDGRRPRRRFVRSIPLWLFTAIGALATVAVAIDWLQGVSTYLWEESTCTIESSEVVERQGSGEYELTVSYRYHARGDTFLGDRVSHSYTGSKSVSEAHRLAAIYAPGETVGCWVDGDEPWNAYLRRANLWRGLMIFIPLAFVAIGLGSLYLVRRMGSEPSAGSRAAPTRPIRVGVIGSILFGAFFLVGFGLFIPFFVWPTLQIVEARSWTPVPCEIVSSGVRSHAGEDSTTYSIEANYRYQIDGRQYESNRYQFLRGSSSGYDGKARAVATIPAGSHTECYVDPDDPYEAVINRGFGFEFLFGLIPLLFGVIGAAGLGFVIWVARKAKREAGRPGWTAPAAVISYPTGPITLEASVGPLGKLGGALFLTLFWNGIVSMFVWVLIRDWASGPDWIMALFLIPFVLIGLLIASMVPYTLLALANPRPTVRLSRAALKAGESAQLDWTFRGAASRIKALEIALECSKRKTSVSDSEIKSSTSTVREIEILDWGEGYPLEFGSVSFRVPSDVEPTRSGPDAVSWKLKFQGRIDYWPDAQEEFEIEIVPPGGSVK